jgi:nucleotide-binding universal stress UspA family protein
MTNGAVKVLIPLDGSKLAEHSLAYIAALRPLGLSEVELVSVTDPLAVPVRRGHEDEDRERNLLTTYLSTIAEDVHTHTTLQVKTRILTGPAPEAIIQEADAYQPDYLVLSTHGASGLSRWRFGSTADKVIRGANCHTLLVGPVAAERESWLEARIMPAFQSILVPLDGSELAAEAQPEAQRFAEAMGARVHVVTAVSVNVVGPNEAWAGISSQLMDGFVEDVRHYLEEVKIKTPGLAGASFEVRIGGAAATLSDYVAEHNIDLVIMTSHGRGGFLRTALGSTTDRLLGGAAPVLIVRPSGD